MTRGWSPLAVQATLTLVVFSVSHRSEIAVRTMLSDLSLTLHLLVKSSQYLLG